MLEKQKQKTLKKISKLQDKNIHDSSSDDYLSDEDVTKY